MIKIQAYVSARISASTGRGRVRPGPASGLLTGDSDLSGDPSFQAFDALLPDLSAGLVSVAAPLVTHATAVAASTRWVEGFQPPLDLPPRDMANFIRDHDGRRPTSLAQMVTATGQPVDPAVVYWMRTAAHLMRSVGGALLMVVQDALRADPTGQLGYERGVEAILRLTRHPLDDGDDDDVQFRPDCLARPRNFLRVGNIL